MGTRNRLGWITSMSFTPTNHLIDATSFADGNSRSFIRSASEIRFSIDGVATGEKGVFEMFQEWMSNGIYGPTFQSEWKCLYCTSPNSIKRTHCTQCGAPRSFILG